MRFITHLRQPEYTGENRCAPCTVINIGIVTVFAALTALFNPLLGTLVLIAGITGTWLRGYVVPYTPLFAPHIVNALPIGRNIVGHHNRNRTTDGLGNLGTDGERVLAALDDAGVFHGDTDLELTPDFRAAWRVNMDELKDEDLAAAVEGTSPYVDQARRHEDGDKVWIIVTDDDRSLASETWLSLPVLIADVAAVRTLTDRGVDSELAVDAAAPLRLFLDECPTCGHEIVETTTDSCCGGIGPGGLDNMLACENCDQRVAILDD